MQKNKVHGVLKPLLSLYSFFGSETLSIRDLSLRYSLLSLGQPRVQGYLDELDDLHDTATPTTAIWLRDKGPGFRFSLESDL